MRSTVDDFANRMIGSAVDYNDIVARAAIERVCARTAGKRIVAIKRVERDSSRAFYPDRIVESATSNVRRIGDVKQAVTVSGDLAGCQTSDLDDAGIDGVISHLEAVERHRSVCGGIVQITNADRVDRRCDRVAGNVHVHCHASNHRSRAASVQNDTARDVAHGVARDVDIDHAALAEANDARVGAADVVVGHVHILDGAVAHRDLDGPGRCRIRDCRIGRRNQAHVDRVVRHRGVQHAIKIDAAPARGSGVVMLDHVARHRQAVDVVEHHARQRIADDVCDLVVRDRPVVAADAAAGVEAEPNRGISRVLNQVVANRQVIVSVRTLLAANGRCTAIERHAVDRDAVRRDRDGAVERALRPARTITCDTSVGTDDLQSLIDGYVLGVGSRRHEHDIAVYRFRDTPSDRRVLAAHRTTDNDKRPVGELNFLNVG